MTVRAATPADVDDVLRVVEASWETDYPDMLNRENLDEAVTDWYDPETLSAEIERGDSVVYVAEADGRTVGFVHAICRHDEGHILRVYVAPDVRGAGHGRALVDRIRDELFDRGVDRVNAMVLAANGPGNAFYEALGFEPSDEGGETEIGGEHYEEHVYVDER